MCTAFMPPNPYFYLDQGVKLGNLQCLLLRINILFTMAYLRIYSLLLVQMCAHL